MDDLLWRTLLLENEGTRLDFKEQQYRFVQASDNEKSELLKDLLAFANAWRTETAYILLGVGAGRAGERELVGLDPSDHVDDATLQQFVNSKVNRNMTFSYQPFSTNGKTFGVISIPVQERPSYLARDYGRLRRHVVYFRLGSSTAEADPTQIAQMRSDDAVARNAHHPALHVSFADLDKRELIGDELALHSRLHAEQGRQKLPDFSDQPGGSPWPFGPPSQLFRSPRKEFWRELAAYVRDQRRFVRVGLAIWNTSSVSAEEVRVVLDAPLPELDVRTRHDMPTYPDSHYNPYAPINIQPKYLSSPTRSTFPAVSSHAGRWEVVIEPGTIRPKQTVWVPAPLLVSTTQSRMIEIRTIAYAANLEEPAHFLLRLRMHVDILNVLAPEDLMEFHIQHTLERAQQDGLVGDDN